ncbi:MAG: potassium channel family protein [Thermanaerothrix sp.]|uniref:Trk system potassium uptake protein TrkA n=1 Tax=Thermanaerothrix solaris TaxID=3058434 RepID=A0ABU3NQY9_9CHLR|nr:NAD-binding protein [Thermanaerothrix sp. 4228-RoL]MDT8899261.1 NAD-binding protein [Thermanaerothrix sp. 4228-RoL]
MFVIIAGGGRTGAQLARILVSQSHKVHLIEHRKEVLARIHRELPTEVVYEGNPIEPWVLEQAGIREADVLAACTQSDEVNLTLCYFARCRYQVPRTIARINNPHNAWLFDEKFHVDVAVNQAEIMAAIIEEEMSLGDMLTLLKLRRGHYSLVEEKILPGAKVIGIPIKDLKLPEHCVIAAIIRNGEVIVPRGVTAIEPGDEILAVIDHEGAKQLAELLSPPEET